jgi:hypothetical protein
MSNKYIEKFFLLTEKNILVDTEYLDSEKEAQSNLFITNYNGYIKYFFGALFITGILYLLVNIQPSKIFLPKTKKVNIVAANNQTILPSVIPNFNIQARRQFLQRVDIKRLDLVMMDESDLTYNYASQAHVTDKVLVVPKSFG